MESCDGNFVLKIHQFFFSWFFFFSFAGVFLFDLFEICLLFGCSHISGLISVVILISLLVLKC